MLHSEHSQTGNAVTMMVLGDYQGMDGPYIIASEFTGKYYIYKYSNLLHQINRFSYPSPRTSAALSYMPTGAFLASTTSGSRQSPTAIYIIGTQTGAVTPFLFVQKLSKNLASLLLIVFVHLFISEFE